MLSYVLPRCFTLFSYAILPDACRCYDAAVSLLPPRHTTPLRFAFTPPCCLLLLLPMSRAFRR